MVTSYTIILCLSALFAAYAFTMASYAAHRLLGLPNRVPEGAHAIAATLAFLAVAAAPAPLLVGCMLLIGMSVIGVFNYLPTIACWGVPLLAAILALSSTTLPVIPGVPPLLLHGVVLGLVFALVMAADHLSDDLLVGSIGFIAALLPLAFAPLIFAAPSFLALDVALVSISLLGVVLATRGSGRLGLARAPFALLCGWLMVQTAIHAAWPCAVLSLLIYAGFAGHHFLRADQRASHAS